MNIKFYIVWWVYPPHYIKLYVHPLLFHLTLLHRQWSQREKAVRDQISSEMIGLDAFQGAGIDGDIDGRDQAALFLYQDGVGRLASRVFNRVGHVPREGDRGDAVLWRLGHTTPHGSSGQVAGHGGGSAQLIDRPGNKALARDKAIGAGQLVIPIRTVAGVTWEVMRVLAAACWRGWSWACACPVVVLVDGGTQS